MSRNLVIGTIAIGHTGDHRVEADPSEQENPLVQGDHQQQDPVLHDPLLEMSAEQREIQALRQKVTDFEARDRERAAQLVQPQVPLSTMDAPPPPGATDTGPSKTRLDKGKGKLPSHSHPQPQLNRMQSVIESRQGYVPPQDRYVPHSTPPGYAGETDTERDYDDDQGEFS